MAVSFKGPDELENFLTDKPVQWSHVIAARWALRVLPLALAGLQRTHWLAIFRACFISWASGKFPGQDLSRFASVDLSSVAYLNNVGVPIARNFVADFPRAVSAVALAAHSVAAAPGKPTAHSAAESIAYSVYAAASVPSPAAATVFKSWLTISHEINEFVVLGSTQSLEESASHSIWSGQFPHWIAIPWQSVVTDEQASHYAPWINWYQALLTGNGPSADYFGPDLTLRIAQQPNEWWDRPAAEVNADISAWLGERQNNNDNFINKVNEVEKQLIQRPAAASFGWTGDQVSVNAPTPLPPASLAQDFLDEVRQKAQQLRNRLAMTNAAQRVRNSLDGVIAILPEQATDLRPGLLRSRARSLHADAAAYAGQFQDGELPVDATAMIIDLSGGLRDLEGCFSELRDIEKEIAALNLKPRDVAAVQKHLEEINNVASESPVVADNAKIVMAAGTETMKAEAPPDITEVRTAEQALTSRNLVNAALQGSLQQILSRVPGTTGRVYDETEKAGLNLIRPVTSVGTALAAGAGATVLFGGLFGPIFALAALGLAEYDRLPGIVNFIKEASNFIKEARKQVDLDDSDPE